MYYEELRSYINDLRPAKKSVAEFITLQSHAKGRPPQLMDAHDIVMAYIDLTLLALLVIRDMKRQGVDYETVERNIMKITKEHPKLLKWLWDNEDCYFIRITKSDLVYKESVNEEETND